MCTILARYHEEQVWSDKIWPSTYGSLAVFVVAVVFVEPWKRISLAQTFGRREARGGNKANTH